MKLTIKTAKLTGRPSELGWTQIHVFTPEEEEKLIKRGMLLGVIALRNASGGNGVNSMQKGREILSRLHEHYYGNLSGGVFQALNDAVQNVHDEFTTYGEAVELACGVIMGKTAYFVCVNGSSIYLMRNQKLVKLIENQSEQVKSVSGELCDQDLVLIGTKQFMSGNQMSELKSFLINHEIDELGEQLAVNFIGGDLASLQGLLVANVNTEKQEQYASEIVTETKEEQDKLSVRQELVRRIDKILDRLPEKRIAVRNDAVGINYRGRKKSLPIVGMILILILASSIFFGVKQRKDKLSREQYQTKLSEARHEYEEAETLAELNKTRSRELVLSAESTIAELIESGIKDEEVYELQRRIADNLGKIAGIYEIEAENFMDLSLISSGFKGNVLTGAGEEMLVLDTEGKRLVGISAISKKTEMIAGPEYLNDAISATGYEGRSFVLSSDGLREVTEDVELLVETDWDVNRILVKVFGGNLYVLDRPNDTIWRYSGVRLGFADKQNWFGEGVAPDLESIVDWAIDGTIWLLSNEGKVQRYSLGSRQGFSLSGPTENLPNFDGIYTDVDSNYLYLLDKESQRVMVYTKEGEYVGEYVSEQLGQAEGMVVSEEAKKIIFLVANRLFEIELKHRDG